MAIARQEAATTRGGVTVRRPPNDSRTADHHGEENTRQEARDTSQDRNQAWKTC